MFETPLLTRMASTAVRIDFAFSPTASMASRAGEVSSARVISRCSTETYWSCIDLARAAASVRSLTKAGEA